MSLYYVKNIILPYFTDHDVGEMRILAPIIHLYQNEKTQKNQPPFLHITLRFSVHLYLRNDLGKSSMIHCREKRQEFFSTIETVLILTINFSQISDFY